MSLSFWHHRHQNVHLPDQIQVQDFNYNNLIKLKTREIQLTFLAFPL